MGPRWEAPSSPATGVFSGDHPLPCTADRMATPGLLQGMHVRSLVVEDPACCVLQPKKKKKSKAAAPTQHSIHNVWVTERSEPLPLTPALEQGLRDFLRKRGWL